MFLKVNVRQITQIYFPHVFIPTICTFILAISGYHLHDLKLNIARIVLCLQWRQRLLWDRPTFLSPTDHTDCRNPQGVFWFMGILQGRGGSRLQWQTNADERTWRLRVLCPDAKGKDKGYWAYIIHGSMSIGCCDLRCWPQSALIDDHLYEEIKINSFIFSFLHI